MIPLYRPFMPDLPELDAILHSGALAYGTYSRQFEQALQIYFGEENLLATNSFHTAISVIISTLRMQHGDEVIASPMACLASTQPYASSGLKVVWADVDNHRGTLDPDSVKARITNKTKAIIHNHFCGYPGHIDAINAIGRDYGIPVVDDGIECFGSRYKGRLIGNCGSDITAFAFTAVRMPNVVDGGTVIFRDKQLYERAILVRDCGIDRRIFRDEIGEIDPACDIRIAGYSATMSNVNGYIGTQQMQQVDRLIALQREQARRWDEQLPAYGCYEPVAATDTLPNYWVYGILAARKREAILQFREKGFYASGVHINNNIYSVFGDKAALPGVNDFYNRFVALPCGWWMA